MDIKNSSLIVIAVFSGGLAVYCAMRLYQYFKGVSQRIAELEAQIKGKQLPFYVSRFLEDQIALEGMQDDDLSTLVLYHQRMGNLLESLLGNKQKDLELLKSMRSGGYRNEAKKSKS